VGAPDGVLHYEGFSRLGEMVEDVLTGVAAGTTFACARRVALLVVGAIDAVEAATLAKELAACATGARTGATGACATGGAAATDGA
jgi:hypothetical protein